MRRGLVIAALLLASGCAQNAVLELQLELPPAPDASQQWFAQVQVRRAESSGFDATWMGDDLPGIELGAASSWACTSVESHDATLDLNVRVRFCKSPRCDMLGDDTAPERRFHIEHPFYLGRHTYWSAVIDEVPECTTDADCALGRCIGNRCGCSTDADCCPASGCTCGASTPCPTCEGDPALCVTQIDRCRVEGCVQGLTTMFCTADGRHFCEERAIDRTEAYMCNE